MNFRDFLSRMDEEIIQEIIGKPAIQILNMLDFDLSKVSNLQEIVAEIHPPIELLQNKFTRDILFDILKTEEVEELSEILNIENSYASIKKLKYHNQHQLISLLSFFEIEYHQEEIIETEYKQNIPASYPLFQHQRRALNELKLKLEHSSERVLLHMPTGSGKTRTAINAICDHLRTNEPTVIIWLAHTEELCEQAASEFARAWHLLGNRDIDLVRYWGGSTASLDSSDDAFIVAGLSKIYSSLKSDSVEVSSLAARCSLVIMDEAHMAIAPTYQLILEVLLSFKAVLLGLSATPGRTWNDIDADQKLADFFGRKKIKLRVEGFDNPVDYLIDQGYLAKIKNSPVLYEHGTELSNKDQEYLEKYLQLSDKYLKVVSEDQRRNILIIQKLEDLCERHNRIIVFAMTVDHAQLIATVLQARGLKAYSITGQTDNHFRKEIIKEFKRESDECMVLCNYGILTTGFDAPQTSCAVITRPTDSLVLYSQMVGRAIRGKAAGGNEEAEIVTVIDTKLPGFDQVANAFLNWEDVWE